MSQFFNRIAGIALIIAGLAGLVFSIAGLVIVSRVEQDVLAGVTNTLDITDRALTTTGDGLVVTYNSLNDARATLSSVVTATSGFTVVLTETMPSLQSAIDLVGGALPDTIATTKDTLLSVSENVKVMDSIIAGITSIPLFGLDALKPTSDLSPGFEQIANSLSGVPDQLRDVSRDMQRATTSIGSMSGVIDNVALNLSAIGGSLDSAQTVIAQYQGVVKDMQGQLTLIRTGMPTWLMYARYGLWALLIWLGIAQLGLLTQGWELMHRPRAAKSANE